MEVLAVLLLLLRIVSHTSSSQANKNVSEVKESRKLSLDPIYAIPLIDCEKRWSCKGYDYQILSTSVRSHYLDKNCACDELCSLLQDCCPDAPHLLGYSAASNEKESPRPPLFYDGNEAALADDLYLDAGGLEKDRNVINPEIVHSRNEVWSSVSEDKNGARKSNAKAEIVYSRYNLSKDVFSCIYDKGINGANNISVVTGCPRGYDVAEVTQLCHNVTDDDMMTRFPVSGKVSRVLYRNMFCAMCHEEPYNYWVVGVECKSSSHDLPFELNSTTLNDLLTLNNRSSNSDSPQEKFCHVTFTPPAADLDLYRWRPCVASVKGHCNQSFSKDTAKGRYIVERCEGSEDRSQKMVFGYTASYRNQFCGMCNLNNHSALFCQPLSWASVTAVPESVGHGRRYPYSFSILLDINARTGSTTVGHRFEYETVERNESVSCDQGHVFDPFRSACRPVTCAPGRHFINNACRKKPPVTDTPTPSNTSDITNTSVISTTTADIFNGTIFDSNCTFIQLNQSEFTLLANGSLQLQPSGAVFDSSLFFQLQERLFLCVRYTQNSSYTSITNVTRVTMTFSLPEAVLSTVGLVVSVLALAVVLGVYGCLRGLHNVPGLTLLSLVAALMAADLLLLLAPAAGGQGDGDAAGSAGVVCAVLGGLMHYCFLAAFLWMNVTAMDVCFTFSKAFVKAGDRGRSSKRFLMYSIYAWITPLVFILPAAMIQVFHSDSSFSPGYGHTLCWLSNKSALLLFFAAPLFLLLLLNLILFVLSAYSIWRARSASARTLGRQEPNTMGIYIRLTIVMGLTWAFGFLAALLPDIKVLVYCFVVMNTLQGLFICISFVFTKKVLALLKDKYHCGRKKVQNPKTPTTALTNLSTSLSANRKLSTTSAKSHSVVV